MSGSEGGSGKRTGGNAGTAPRLDPTRWSTRCEWPQLALDQRQRDPLAQQLDSVRVAQLMGSEPPADASVDRDARSSSRAAVGRPAAPAGGSVDDAEQRPGRQYHAVRQPRRRAVRTRTGPFRPRDACHPCRGGPERPAPLIDVGLVRAPTPQRYEARPPQTATSAADTQPVSVVAGLAHHQHDLLRSGGSGGYRMPLLRGARPARYPGMVAGDRRRPAAFTRIVEAEDMTGSPR